MRTAMRRGLVERRPRGKLQRLLGWSINDLAIHLEKQFKDGMSWSNMDKWDVDHVVPLVKFKFTSNRSPEFRAAWAITNLQPMWSGENRKKSAHRLYLL
jgi:hypothetical protein